MRARHTGGTTIVDFSQHEGETLVIPPPVPPSEEPDERGGEPSPQATTWRLEALLDAYGFSEVTLEARAQVEEALRREGLGVDPPLGGARKRSDVWVYPLSPQVGSAERAWGASERAPSQTLHPPAREQGPARWQKAVILTICGVLALMAPAVILSATGNLSRLLPSRQTVGSPTVRVERVIAGDTVVLARFGKTRLIGVDAPREGRCGETAATRFTRRRLEGKRVRYELGAKRKDLYDRTLAYLSRGSKMHNLALIEKGYATALNIPPNDKYSDRFEAAENEAKQQEEGPQATCAQKRQALARKRARARERVELRRADQFARRIGARERRRRATERRAERHRSRGGLRRSICSRVDGPIPTPPGDRADLDVDNDGKACE